MAKVDIEKMNETSWNFDHYGMVMTVAFDTKNESIVLFPTGGDKVTTTKGMEVKFTTMTPMDVPDAMAATVQAVAIKFTADAMESVLRDMFGLNKDN